MKTKTKTMLFLIFLLHFSFSSALICPIYSSRQIDSHQHRYLRHCQSNCSFKSAQTDREACLGIYANFSGEIFIKQLGIIHRDELCAQSKECLLDVDPLNPQIFTCCCSTENCTLTWKHSPSTTTTTKPKTKTSTATAIEEENSFSWKLFLLLSLGLCTLILLILLLTFCRTSKDHHRSMEKSRQKSISIENLFFSAERLLSGKSSTVYKGIYHHQSVALKVYQNTHLSVWTNEMILLKSIDHQSIIKIIADGQYDSHWYLIFPFYENGTLQSFLRTTLHRPLTMDQCLTYCRSLASAIAYLHLGQNSTGLTIVHRDIKSSNILVSHDGTNLCLTDFGMAAALPRILKEKDFVQIGTMRYMAPELLEGVIAHTREALCSVDIYALALVMWEILSQCDRFVPTAYRSPYDEYLINANDRSSFSLQLYDIVVTRRLRPTLLRPLKDPQSAPIVQQIAALIEACWNGDPDLRMNAQTLAFKLDQIHG